MWNFLGIRHYFQKVAEEQAARKARDQKFTEAIDAIDAGDVVRVQEIAAGTGFSYGQTNAMLIKAIDTDHVEMFKAVLNGKGFNGDMNEMLHFHSPIPGAGYYRHSKQSMLYVAINHEKTNIAVWLAENPETDITQSGSWETTTYHSGGLISSGHSERKGNDYPAPLKLARELEMNEVIVLLARREGNALLREAQALSPA